MKQSIHKFLLPILGLVTALVMVLPSGSAHAADTKWINQVWNDYKAYNKKITEAYKADQQQMDANYKEYLKQYTDRMNSVENKVLADQKEWNEKLQADLTKLQEQYGGSREKADDLRKYKQMINPKFMDSPMNRYATQANRNFLNSTMWEYSKALNENFLNSKTWKYKKDINPNFLDSPAFKYKNAVNENFLNSPMQKLKMASSKDYVNSPMLRYNIGKISKTKAQQEYAKIYKEQTANLAAIIKSNKQAIANTEAETRKELDALHEKSVDDLEKQREETLRSISEMRARICGEGLSWQPLLKAQ
ncbi:hypothetical protein [Paenibacillus donghaensis]|uniref:hypothetical protein n=1 Tax=Paenibacillus donghaensis TaxID=414771 RepID=UPI001D16E1FD|nr:hypothetical protein [Paenibacillus donghaensis]